MSEEAKETESGEQQAPESKGDEQGEEVSGGQKIMCFVSKEMVPMHDTVEVDYMPGKTVRVLPKYIKYDRDDEE